MLFLDARRKHTIPLPSYELGETSVAGIVSFVFSLTYFSIFHCSIWRYHMNNLCLLSVCPIL